MNKELIKARKKSLIRIFSRTQWENMNRELPEHGWSLVGNDPISYTDIPQEILKFKEDKIKKLKNEDIEKEVQTEKGNEEVVPGFEEEKPKNIIKKKGGRPAKKK